ncbi:unnamed protein product [Anisakis simplex]|uniref:WAPL domain-containing protein n=1 Tax=Anisakis simplex TaxID=6269 RepID=A0A0M3KF03_ANISI|nr:unnamed protein product [Anisakis simplex]
MIGKEVNETDASEVSPSLRTQKDRKSVGSHSRHAFSSVERDRRMLNAIQSTLRAERSPNKPVALHEKCDNDETHNVGSVPTNAQEIIEKMTAMTIDKQTPAQDIRRLLLARDVQKLGDETWAQLGNLLADVALEENGAHLAVDMTVLVVGTVVFYTVSHILKNHRSFQKSFSERISSEMSSYVLCPEIAKSSLPELVALLLVASWPRPHSRSSDDSNQILYTIISSIKDWLVTLTDEVEDDIEMMSRCAIGIGEICRLARYRFWMQWPELVDEIYVAINKVLTSNVPLTQESKTSLLNVYVQMHSWKPRTAKSTLNACTQTTFS